MYKPTLIKLLNQLKTNISETLNDHENTKLYIKSWVIGAVDMLINKANNKTAFIYPYNATYKYLFDDLLKHFYCVNICESIKEETIKQLTTTNNILLLRKLNDLINK